MATDQEPQTTIDSSILTAMFKCPVCYGFSRPPILTCMAGHIVCSNCYNRINVHNSYVRCPMCRGPMGEHKNLILEKIALLLPYPCAFSSSGCTVISTLPQPTIDSSRLTAMFKCPVCCCFIRPPILTCMAGHIVCPNCYALIKDNRRISLEDNSYDPCPTCRGPVGEQRNLILEKIALLLPYPCALSSSGCTVILTLSKLLIHEKICTFLSCPYVDFECGWVGVVDQLLPHLKEHKELAYRENNTMTIIITDLDSKVQPIWMILLQCFNSDFIVIIKKQTQNQLFPLHVITKLIGSEENASKFKYTVSFKSKIKKISFETLVAGIQADFHQIRNDNKRVQLGEYDISHIRTGDYIEFKISIQSLDQNQQSELRFQKKKIKKLNSLDLNQQSESAFQKKKKKKKKFVIL